MATVKFSISSRLTSARYSVMKCPLAALARLEADVIELDDCRHIEPEALVLLQAGTVPVDGTGLITHPTWTREARVQA
jgi:hypothetical protein